MAFAETNRVALGIKEETTWGEYASGDAEEVRFTSDTFGQTQNTTISNEIRSDRQVPDIIRTGIAPEGGWNGEISYGVEAFELAIKAILGASGGFGTPPAALEGEIQAVESSSKFITDSTGDGVDFSSLSVGDWVEASGFTNSGNNGFYQVTAVDTSTAAAHEITVTGSLTDEAAGAVATQSIQGSAALRNGTSKYSYSVEKQFLDLNSGSGLAVRLLGYRFGGLTLNLTPESIATFELTGQGKIITDTTNNDLTDGSASLDFTTLATLTDAAANDIMNTIDGIGELIINRDDPIAATVESVTLNPTNALRRQAALQAGLGSAGIGLGRFSVAGSLSAYFEDKNILQEHLLFNDTDLAVVTKDSSGNKYLWDVPAIRLGGDGIPKGTGVDEDAMIAVDIAGKRSTRNGLDYMLACHKFVA